MTKLTSSCRIIMGRVGRLGHGELKGTIDPTTQDMISIYKHCRLVYSAQQEGSRSFLPTTASNVQSMQSDGQPGDSQHSQCLFDQSAAGSLLEDRSRCLHSR